MLYKSLVSYLFSFYYKKDKKSTCELEELLDMYTNTRNNLKEVIDLLEDMIEYYKNLDEENYDKSCFYDETGTHSIEEAQQVVRSAKIMRHYFKRYCD